MAPKSDDGKSLLEISVTSLKAQKVATLQDFCTTYGLEVACTGKWGRSTKVDYLNAILVHVSDLHEPPTTVNVISSRNKR